MKKFIILAITGMATMLSFNSFKSPTSDPQPPSGYTGAPTQSRYCTNCHGDFGINTAGGSVYATGLPTGTYIAGQVYNFSVTITNATAMQNWGFEIKAVVAGNSTALGTFSTTNPNAMVSSSELKHNAAAVSTGTSYTYNNLKWTAPSTGSSAVSFYMTGVAGDNDGSENGDYVYSSTILSVPIPVTLSDFSGRLEGNTAILDWKTYTESGSKHFEIERSFDAINFEVIQTMLSSGNSNSLKTYSFVDNKLPVNKQQIYYRLKLVDINGKTEYSKVIVLKPSVFTYIESIYPTVISNNDIIHIKIVSDKAQPSMIAVYSTDGRRLIQQPQMLVKGLNEFTVNSFALEGAGTYIIQIKAVDFTESRKLLVR